jgi:xanthine dehydrogenase large subunit
VTGARFAGRPLPHESARGHVTGEALYTDDLCGRFPHLAHAWPVLAPHAHAYLRTIHSAAALSEPGVIDVLTGDDVRGDANTGPSRHDEPLFPQEVMFHRQPVAWVLADTLDAARRGALRISATYEELPAILTIDEAIRADSFLTDSLRIINGDLSALAASAVRIDGELTIGGQEHFYLETQSALAWLDESGGMSVQSSTQHPSETQEVVARVLGVPRNQVNVECLRMGGAFGGKETQANTWAAIAAIGARKTRRPVRVRLTRALDMALTGKRHPYLARYCCGLAGSGRLEALRLELFSDGGWSLDLSEPIMWRSLFHCDNAYRLPAVEATGRVCRTHKTSQTAFRGFGGPQAMLVIETILSQAARRLSMSPDEIRERNFYRDGYLTHYGQPIEDASRLSTIWTQLKRTSSYSERVAGIRTANARSTHLKRGIAITPVKFGISFTATFYNQAGALVLVYRDGSAQVNHGGTEMGQGLVTKVQQIAADGLGLTLDRIRMMPTRTDKVANTSATAASSGTDLNGAAVADACVRIIERLTPIAAHLLECDAGEVTFSNGAAHGGGRTVPFADVCETAYKRRMPLSAQGFYRTPAIHFDAATGRGRPFYYFVWGAAVSEVEVDGFTGQYRLLRTDILEDAGEAIAPTIDRGQVEGGFIQGVGWLTLEELLWDAEGRVATAGASTYKLPSWSEMPPVFNVNFLERAYQPGVILGSKAVGEPPLMLAISVREALRDAVAAFSPDVPGAGLEQEDLPSPLTPEQVFFAVRRVQAKRASLAVTTHDLLIRAPFIHTVDNPFRAAGACQWQSDGGLLIRAGLIAASGPFNEVRRQAESADVLDWRGGYVLPGLVDTHVHYPQLRIIGGLGRTLLDWLEHVALPEEARMADAAYAAATAHRFVHALLSHGTTTALVFGAHFPGATASLFEAAQERGLRLTSGLVLSDRGLRPELLQSPDEAHRESTALIERFHGKGRLLYAVTPRFALSTTEAMLEVCQSLLREHRDLRVQTHLNEQPEEIAACLGAFPWATDYLSIYERYSLAGSGTVMAHSVHTSDAELARMGASRTAVAHCPCSNAALGSGIFPFRRHLSAGVHCALGTDVGGGTGFGILKEALQAYLMQRVSPDGIRLGPEHLLYLGTRAGAEALGLADRTGDLTAGKSADLIYIRPDSDNPLTGALSLATDMGQVLAALVTMSDASAIREVRIAGEVVFARHHLPASNMPTGLTAAT